MDVSAGTESSPSIPNSSTGMSTSTDATPALLKTVKLPTIISPSIPASIVASTGGSAHPPSAAAASIAGIVSKSAVLPVPTAPHSTTATSTAALANMNIVNQETYYGLIDTVQDAMLVIQAAKCGLLPRVRGRLSDRERKGIRSGSVFVFLESESRIRRWTDGKVWSPSRIAGEFLVYREQATSDTQLPSGLIKKTISLNLATNPVSTAAMTSSSSINAVYSSEAFHLVAYFREQDKAELAGLVPSRVPFFTGNPVLLPSLMRSILPSTLDAAPIQPAILPRSTTPTSQQMNELTGHFRLAKRHMQQAVASAQRFAHSSSAQNIGAVAIAPRNQTPGYPVKQVNYVASAAAPSAEDQLLFTHFLSSLHASSNPHSSGTDSVEHRPILSSSEKRPYEAVEDDGGATGGASPIRTLVVAPEEDAQQR